MGKLFRGLAQGGSWVCLDEFNRIDIEVLSVVAQQLLVLRNGRQMKKDHINFMGITISLQDHHVIITMNPGYAGRTEVYFGLDRSYSLLCFRAHLVRHIVAARQSRCLFSSSVDDGS